MVKSLLILPLGVDILKEKNFEQLGFKVDVHKPRAHLDDCEVKDEYRADYGQMEIIIHISEAIVLFICKRFYDFIKDVLLELVNRFFSMLKELSQIGVVAPFPLRSP